MKYTHNMAILTIVLIAVLVLVMPASAVGPVELWNATYGDYSSHQQGCSIAEAADGGYIGRM